MKTLNRRTLLRGVGGAAIALPYLEIMMSARTAHAQAGAISKVGANGLPKRFLFIYTPNGHGVGWFKNTAGPDGKIATLGQVLAPLERHKDDLILIDGLANRTSLMPSEDGKQDGGHGRPMMHLGACMPMQRPIGMHSVAGGISIDQAIANGVAGDTKFKSLVLSVPGNIDYEMGWLSYTAAKAQINPEPDPAKTFKKLFTDFQTDPNVLARLRARRMSILDSVKKNYEGFISTLGGEDQQKVKNHLDGIREIETRLTSKPLDAKGACAIPAAAAKGPNDKESGQQQVRLIALAFACDLSRVASLCMAYRGMPWIGVGDVHGVSHGGDEGRNMTGIEHAKMMADYIDILKNAKDASGSVWDNTVLYHTTEHGTGNHNNNQMPVLVAGSAGGYFKTGRILKFAENIPGSFLFGVKAMGPGHGELHTSFLNAMGVPAMTFGVPEHCRGPLPNMV